MEGRTENFDYEMPETLIIQREDLDVLFYLLNSVNLQKAHRNDRLCLNCVEDAEFLKNLRMPYPRPEDQPLQHKFRTLRWSVWAYAKTLLCTSCQKKLLIDLKDMHNSPQVAFESLPDGEI